jgi:hypothetical protein
MSQNLRQKNADLRDLLRENLLTCWSKREHWEDTEEPAVSMNVRTGASTRASQQDLSRLLKSSSLPGVVCSISNASVKYLRPP